MPDQTSATAPPLILVLVAAAGDDKALADFLVHLHPAPVVATLVMPLTGHDRDACLARLRDPAVALPISEAVNGRAALADRLHLVPPEAIADVQNGRLQLSPLREAGPASAIDRSLEALGRSHGDRVIAVLFAGAVNHAFIGVTALKEAGGMLLVEEAGGGTGAASAEVVLLADHLQPAAELAGRVHEHVAYRSELGPSPLPSPTELERIVALIGSQTGMDFSEYKNSTLQRRIQRRIGINHLADVGSYIDLLQRSPSEATILYREMLIGVTRFFRDPEAFAALAASVVQPLISSPDREDPVRIWVAGCATGEEAYSIAIILREAMAAAGVERPAKIFATDLDREAVQFASLGIYPLAIAADVSAERLKAFFTRKAEGYQVAKAVREMVVFANHNIVRDPPFFRMDLVTCRNLLIYLQPALQQRLFNAFHFALKPEGHLMLGTSETLGDMAPYFAPVEAKWKIYRRRGNRLPRMSDSLSPHRLASRHRPGGEGAGSPPAAAAGLEELVEQTLLNDLMPAFLVVDGDFEIHYLSGTVERFLALPRGKPSFNLLKMVSRELAVAVSTGVRRVLRDGVPVVFDEIAVRSGEDSEKVRLVIRPLNQRSDLGYLAVVVFEEPGRGGSGGQQFDIAAQTDLRIKDLEIELDQNKESLQAAIEELETSNEELQATNEEVLAANEELQSTNEELQSVNEELHSIDVEHQAKIAELTELNNDILNLLAATNIGTIFLDQRLCVRKFTRAATEQINLIDKDIGRPLAHISNNIEYANLVTDAEEVLRTLVPKQRKVCTRTGRWHLMRMLPYRTEDNIIKGVIITFIDVAETKVASEQIRRLVSVIENSPLIAMILNAVGDIEYVNQRFVEVTGWPVDEALGRNPRFLVRSGQASATDLPGTLGAGRTWRGLSLNQTRGGEPYAEEAVMTAIAGEGGRIDAYLRLSSVVPG